MTEREYLQQLFEDVRAYFRYEAEPLKQNAARECMRDTMYSYMEARENDNFDTE